MCRSRGVAEDRRAYVAGNGDGDGYGYGGRLGDALDAIATAVGGDENASIGELGGGVDGGAIKAVGEEVGKGDCSLVVEGRKAGRGRGTTLSWHHGDGDFAAQAP